MQRGSSEAISAVLSAMRQSDSDDPQKELVKKANEQLTETKRQTAMMRKQQSAPIIEFIAGTV